MPAPNPIAFQALRGEARKKGLILQLGTSPERMVVLARYAKDRKAVAFPNRDQALAYLRTLPDVSPVRR